MKKKDIKLFNLAIHNIKTIIYEIKKEREQHHNELDKMKEEHDKKMTLCMEKTDEVLDELYQLYLDLTDNDKKEEK